MRAPRGFGRCATIDETRIHYYVSESNKRFAQWLEPGESLQNQPKVLKQLGRHFPLFVGIHKELLIYIISKQLKQLQSNIMLHYQSNRKMQPRKNTPLCNDQIERYEIWNSFLCAKYSWDMGPNDCFLFPKVNRWLKGARFFSNEEAKFGTEVYFEVLEKS